jgi:hypothetical protein
MAVQVAEHLQLDNGLLMPQDSVDGISGTPMRPTSGPSSVTRSGWLKTESHSLGLSDLVDQVQNKVSILEITDTIYGDINMQITGKYKGLTAIEETKAYEKAIAEVRLAGKKCANNDIEKEVNAYSDIQLT